MKYNVEEAFLSCGNNHKYQKIVLIAILFTWLSVDFVSLIFPLFELEPKYECQIENKFVKCDNTLACSLPADKVNRIVEYRNILSDFAIDCSKVELIFVGVVYTVGILMGSFVSTIYSDIVGRKPVLLVSEVVFFGATALLINSPNYYFILVSLFLCGVSCSGGTIISYLYINEIIAKEKRSFYGIIISIFFAIGGLLYFACFQFLKNWVHLTYICMGFDFISFLMTYFYFIESPRYYYSGNMFCRSLEALYAISIKNSKQDQFEFFIKKNYIFFLQGNNSNRDLYFEDVNFRNSTFDNTNNYINGNSTSADLINNTHNNLIVEANENNEAKEDCLDLNSSKSTRNKPLDDLNIKEIFEFLEKYELEISERQRKFNAEANKNQEGIDDQRNNLGEDVSDENDKTNSFPKKQNNIFSSDKGGLHIDEEKHEPFLDIENLSYKNCYKFKKEKQTKEENEAFSAKKTSDNLIDSDDTSFSGSIAPEKEVFKNAKTYEKEKLSNLKVSDYPKPVRKTSSYFSLIKYKSIRHQFLICNLVWFTYAFSYYGISFYLKKGGGEVFLDGYIIYTAEVISLIITFFIMSSSFFGRVRTINIMMIISGISTLSFYYMKNKNIEYYDKIPLFLSRFSITAINSTMYTYSTEFYPTIIRAKGLGINIFFARIACCLVPVLIELLNNPFIIFSVLCFFTSIFTFFLPETLNKELEDEILEERGK